MGKENNLSSKIRIAIIIAFKDFRDVEYFVPKQILERAGFEIKTASNKKGKAVGADGGDVEAELLTYEIDMADFDAVIFVGGPGCLDALDNEDSYKIAREAFSKNKVLAAICISPIILSRAGVLVDKKATVWSDPMEREAIKILEGNGAFYQAAPVVVDENIITADGPAAAREFAEKIKELLIP